MSNDNAIVYQGNEPYIFVSYAHANDKKVLPIIRGLQQSGFRVWYDTGIEVGTEWPDYIAQKLLGSDCVLVFMSPDAEKSHNCRREINLAVKHKPDRMLVAYLEKFALSPGMELQLDILQAVFRDRFTSDESFVQKLCEAKLLENCKGKAAAAKKPAPAPGKKPDGYVRTTGAQIKNLEESAAHISAEDRARVQVIERTLSSFRIDANVCGVAHGAAVTRFALEMASGVKMKSLSGITDNLAMALRVMNIRLQVPIPGTALVGIEVPNEKPVSVPFSEVFDSPAMQQHPSRVAAAIGKNIDGEPIVCDLAKMPHLLMAGAAGSGKSVCVNSIILSMLCRATPQQVRLLLIDPTGVELQNYSGIPHLLTDVISDPGQAVAALDWAVQEMNVRYRLFQQAHVRNLASFNQAMPSSDARMPEIAVVIDELGALMMHDRKQTEEFICRLAMLGRAAGIHMIIATQRPSADVLTGIIRANIPSRIAFALPRSEDSRMIIDTAGAEKLLGYGDMLYFPSGEFHPTRVQGCFVSGGEMASAISRARNSGAAVYDPRLEECIARAADGK